MNIIHLKNQQEYEDYFENNRTRAERIKYESRLVEAWQSLDLCHLDGYCIACERKNLLLVDKLYGAEQSGPGWLPNWRERLVCPGCELNNRQRAVIHALKLSLSDRTESHRDLALYAMEQVTPLFNWLDDNFPIECVGSEFLGDETTGTNLIRRTFSRILRARLRIRHENVESLSFDADLFDFVVSNDVLEHVNDPKSAIAEVMRVLKPNGEFYLSVPFMPDMAESRRRASLSDGKVKHYLPEQYHGNPLSDKGSLVFHDYGWDLLSWIRELGFRKVKMCLYWSKRYGYLGDPQYYFHAVKPGKTSR